MDNDPTFTFSINEIGSMLNMLSAAHREGMLHPEDFVDDFDRAVFYKAIAAAKPERINLLVSGKAPSCF